jgi:uncharacterized protein YrzB (UPF0473 family)
MSEDFSNDYITLIDENGEENEFEHIDSVEIDGVTYVALIPVYADPAEAIESDGELVILKVVTDETTGEDILSSIEDEEEYDEVADIFIERLEDYYEIQS